MCRYLTFNSFSLQQQTKLTSPTGGASAAANNPFLSSPTNAANIVDLFGPTAASAQPPNAKASDDLLQLGNPFADMFGAPTPAQPLVGNVYCLTSQLSKLCTVDTDTN